MSAFNGSVTVFLIQHRAKRTITLALPPRGPDAGQELLTVDRLLGSQCNPRPWQIILLNDLGDENVTGMNGV